MLVGFLGLTNRAAKGRSAVWSVGKVVRLFKGAWREGDYGLAALIAVLWSTQQSPGDVRTLRASQLVTDGAGTIFFTDRAKTGKPVGGALSDRALAAAETYLKVLGVELHGDAFLFRNRSGAPYSSDTLGDDFRDVRHRQFGSAETGRWPTSAGRGSGGVHRGCPPGRHVPCHGQHHSHLEHGVRHVQPGQHGLRAQGA